MNDDDDDSDPLRTARGILYGVGMGTAAWIVLLTVYFILK
jgi:hypothetical protein